MNFAIVIPFLIFCIAIAFIDLKTRTIPNAITIPGSLFGILMNGHTPGGIGYKAAIGAWALGCACMGLSGILNYMKHKRPMLGGGDLQLLGMVGAFCGWKVVLATYAIAPFIASAWHIKTLKSSMAYGCAIIEAAVIAMFIFR